ncbi:hypothetical protein E2C01_097307 [Portunus trituberculatus]|uniref:Uncharacterized protein n=1 Tax=Portunus trituberculatus TaxID=210409 RepID=A0A5B7K5D3_PORTR|nr:hypothetical protein [Portunus trituberculatus]
MHPSQHHSTPPLPPPPIFIIVRDASITLSFIYSTTTITALSRSPQQKGINRNLPTPQPSSLNPHSEQDHTLHFHPPFPFRAPPFPLSIMD